MLLKRNFLDVNTYGYLRYIYNPYTGLSPAAYVFRQVL